jgi:NADP-dependent 3-hydroxy acid dehydrogenase YdfG
MAQQVALVTGVSSGIGLATATRLLREGFSTFGTIRETSRVTELPTDLELIRLDVRNEESGVAGVKTVLDRAGRIDALVNNAGSVLFGSLEETSIDEAKGLFETNFFGVLRLCQAVLPIMRQQRQAASSTSAQCLDSCRRRTWESTPPPNMQSKVTPNHWTMK